MRAACGQGMFLWGMFLWALLFPAGCGPSAVRPPSVDPTKATDEAIATLDRDGDGALSQTEIADCPALRDAAIEYDLDRNQKPRAKKCWNVLPQCTKAKSG